jgi:hypothetical protein
MCSGTSAPTSAEHHRCRCSAGDSHRSGKFQIACGLRRWGREFLRRLGFHRRGRFRRWRHTGSGRGDGCGGRRSDRCGTVRDFSSRRNIRLGRSTHRPATSCNQTKRRNHYGDLVLLHRPTLAVARSVHRMHGCHPFAPPFRATAPARRHVFVVRPRYQLTNSSPLPQIGALAPISLELMGPVSSSPLRS